MRIRITHRDKEFGSNEDYDIQIVAPRAMLVPQAFYADQETVLRMLYGSVYLLLGGIRMGFLDSIEKLINEHGSATILRERIALLNDQYSAIERQVVTLQQQVTNLQSENESLKLDKRQLQGQVVSLATKLSHNTNPHGYVFGHCGSPQLKRTGNRPDPTFGDLGIKQAIFSCVSCGKESGFTQNA